MATFTVDMNIEPKLDEFARKDLATECPWATDEQQVISRVTDLISFLLTEEGVDKDTEVSVSFVDKTRIAELNAEFRNIDSPTDVLSFPCDEPDEVEGEPLVALGDIVIAPEVALAQSKEFGTTFIQEVTLLLTHGVLHLLGYDHIIDEEAEVMEARERELRSKWEQR